MCFRFMVGDPNEKKEFLKDSFVNSLTPQSCNFISWSNFNNVGYPSIPLKFLEPSVLF